MGAPMGAERVNDHRREPWSFQWFIERADRIAARAAGAHERERARLLARANPPDVVDETWAQYAAGWREAAQLARELDDAAAAVEAVAGGDARRAARSEFVQRLHRHWQNARHAGNQGRWWAFFEAYEWARE